MRDVVYEEIFRNELTHAWYLGTRELMLKYLCQYANHQAKILDAGSGTGGTIKFLQSKGFTRVIGIDNSQTAIGYAKKGGIKNLKLGSVNKLPYLDKTFDVVICLDVLYHKKVIPAIAMKEFNRVLKIGGTLYLQEPAYKFLKSNHDIVIETGRRFLKSEIENLAISSGFKIKKATYFNSIFLIPIIVKRFLETKVYKNNIQSDVKSLNPILNKIYLKILLLEAKLVNYFSFPFGLSIILIGQKS